MPLGGGSLVLLMWYWQFQTAKKINANEVMNQKLEVTFVHVCSRLVTFRLVP